MTSSTEDQAKGAFHETKGSIKQKVGELINDPELATEGQDEKIAGQVEKKIGQIKAVFEK